MGLLIEGVWHDQWYDTGKTKGRFVRQDSAFRNKITNDGSSEFPAVAGRYHLYVSLACPWAHRTLIFRKVKKLEEVISVSVVDPFMGEHGWFFGDSPGGTPDHLYGKKFLHEIYTKCKPDYTGRVTVPVLWDKETETIVNNESSEIILMLNEAFNEFGDASLDFYPEELREEIEKVNESVYPTINNGVYRAGFATSQDAYEEAYDLLFESLDRVESILAEKRYLTGDRITTADWRLFTTLIRFDAVYHGHFKCNLRLLSSYENISGYVRELYQFSGVKETVDFFHIKHHYYASHHTINPTRVVPKGPKLDFDQPHGRG